MDVASGVTVVLGSNIINILHKGLVASPVVDGLRVSREERPRHHHAGQELCDVRGVVPHIVPRGGGAAGDT